MEYSKLIRQNDLWSQARDFLFYELPGGEIPTKNLTAPMSQPSGLFSSNGGCDAYVTHKKIMFIYDLCVSDGYDAFFIKEGKVYNK